MKLEGLPSIAVSLEAWLYCACSLPRDVDLAYAWEVTIPYKLGIEVALPDEPAVD